MSNPQLTATAIESTDSTPHTPRVIPRQDHPISRKNISPNALKVLYRLNKAGYDAYLVGGSVRDLLLGREPKDFDVATNALPEQIRELFRNCRLIGRRFRLAHVHFGNEIIEVATFRGAIDAQEGDVMSLESGMIVRDNAYGTLESDARRRDFTLNSLYYSVEDFSVIDYVGGLTDLEACTIRPIGDPDLRFREDPVRMLRAVRFAAKLGFQIESHTYQTIVNTAECLKGVPPARLFDEVLKLFLTGCAEKTFNLLQQTGLLNHLLPETAETLSDNTDWSYGETLACALRNTDLRVLEEKPVTPSFLMAALLWPQVRRKYEQLMKAGEKDTLAMQFAMDEMVDLQMQRVTIPRRFSVPMRDIWSFQLRLEKRNGKRPLRLSTHQRFRAAYDFLSLRALGGESEQLRELAQWWKDFQEAPNKDRERMVKPRGRGDGRMRRKKKTGAG